MESNHEATDELLQDIQALLYPAFPPGCQTPAFLQHIQPLLEAIFRFDVAAEPNQDLDSTILQLITSINTCFTHCPRKQLMSRVLEVIGKCKGALKNLAVGRLRIKYSKWEVISKKNNPILKLYAITQPTLRQATDLYYLKNRKIPHLELFLLDYPPLLLSKQNFEDILVVEGQLNAHQHHYIALIAAATMGCKYIWLRAVQKFLAEGGDESWIKEGISVTPPFLQKIGRLSVSLAYNISGLMKNNSFNECSSTKQREQLLEGLVVLVYYQCLSCLSMAGGLVHEWDNNEKYLPKTALGHSSEKSFEIVRLYQKKLSQFQEDIAEDIGEILNEQQSEEEVLNIQEPKSLKSLAERKAKSYHRIKKISFQSLDKEDLQDQLQNLRCIQELRKTFAKYVNFQSFSQIFRASHPMHQNDLILSSEWEWEMQALQSVQSVLGGKVRGALQEMVVKMKVLSGEGGRKIAHYYHFSNNYIHEFINYRRLLQELGSVEREYLKVVTKSPFLFSESAFSKMEQQLKKNNIEAIEFVLHSTGCKLELAVTLITLLFDRSQQEQ